jgi:hypothetical protein
MTQWHQWQWHLWLMAPAMAVLVINCAAVVDAAATILSLASTVAEKNNIPAATIDRHFHQQ